RLTLERAGKNFHAVRFLARRDDARLAGPPAVEVRLNVRLRELESRRAAVHDHAHAAAVGFAPHGDAEQLPEAVCHARSVGKKLCAVKPCERGARTALSAWIMLGALGL